MFKNPFSFKGRIRRTEYGLSFIIYLVPAILISAGMEESKDTAVLLFLFLALVPVYWFLWSQGARRCHDRGFSGWFQIIPFYVLWMLFGDGENGVNKYGPNPKGIGNPEQPTVND